MPLPQMPTDPMMSLAARVAADPRIAFALQQLMPSGTAAPQAPATVAVPGQTAQAVMPAQPAPAGLDTPAFATGVPQTDIAPRQDIAPLDQLLATLQQGDAAAPAAPTGLAALAGGMAGAPQPTAQAGPLGRLLPEGLRNPIIYAIMALNGVDERSSPLMAGAQGFAGAQMSQQAREERKRAEAGGAEALSYARSQDALQNAYEERRIRLSEREMERQGREPIEVGGALVVPDGNGGYQEVYRDQPAGQMFAGNGLDAQALNELVRRRIITEEQALDIAAGKTVTGPNGEMLFMTPSALVGGSDAQEGGATTLTGPKLTEDMRKAEGFAARMAVADQVISDPNVSAEGQSLYNRAASSAPFGLGNYAVSEDFQKFDQAQRDFVNANLRRESGAVISDEEFANARIQYFPQPGDGPEVLAQKAANRRLAIESLQTSAAPNQTFPDQESTPAAPEQPAVDAGAAVRSTVRQRAVNPQTGEAVEWDGKAWVPVQP